MRSKPLSEDQEILRDILAAVRGKGRGRRVLFRDFALEFFDRYCKRAAKPGTAATRSKQLHLYLIPTLKGRYVHEIDDDAVADAKAFLSTLGPRTINGALGLLSMVLKDAMAEGLIEHLPRIHLVPVRIAKKKPHDVAPFLAMVDAAKRLGWRHWNAVLLAGDAAMRASECAGLPWRLVDLNARAIDISEQDYVGRVAIDPKSLPREVPITDGLFEALQAAESPRDGRVLIGLRGKPIGRSTVRKWIVEAADAAGLDHKGGAHALRHACASQMGALGVDPITIMEILGHSSLDVVSKYTHAYGRLKRDAIRALSATRTPK